MYDYVWVMYGHVWSVMYGLGRSVDLKAENQEIRIYLRSE